MLFKASGYPPHVTSREEKNYIEHYLINQGIALVEDKICKNPGLRLVEKLYLNSCWGKFCERQNPDHFVKTRLELARISEQPSQGRHRFSYNK